MYALGAELFLREYKKEKEKEKRKKEKKKKRRRRRRRSLKVGCTTCAACCFRYT
jgi:hypothetical protein